MEKRKVIEKLIKIKSCFIKNARKSMNTNQTKKKRERTQTNNTKKGLFTWDPSGIKMIVGHYK